MQNINKNEKVNLAEVNPNLSKLLVGLGWKFSVEEQKFDLDASAFMLTKEKEVRDRRDFVYYKNLQDPSGALKHSGDNTAGGEGDSEQILVDLSKVPSEIGHITFVVTIFDALNRQQTFGKVEEAFIRVVDRDTDKELVRYNLGKEYFTATSLVVGDIHRKESNDWTFDAVGAPFSGGLEAIAADFDLDPTK